MAKEEKVVTEFTKMKHPDPGVEALSVGPVSTSRNIAKKGEKPKFETKTVAAVTVDRKDGVFLVPNALVGYAEKFHKMVVV